MVPEGRFQLTHTFIKSELQIDDNFLAAYHANYGVPQPETTPTDHAQSTPVVTTQEERGVQGEAKAQPVKVVVVGSCHVGACLQLSPSPHRRQKAQMNRTNLERESKRRIQVGMELNHVLWGEHRALFIDTNHVNYIC